MTTASTKAYCMVPGCTNSKAKTPDKLFFPVPRSGERIKWFQAAKRDPLSETTPCWCCEDHFKLEQDVDEWARHKISKDAGLAPFKLRLKPGVRPHIFNCQPDRKLCHEKPPRSVVLKRQRLEILKELDVPIGIPQPTFSVQAPQTTVSVKLPKHTTPNTDIIQFSEDADCSSAGLTCQIQDNVQFLEPICFILEENLEAGPSNMTVTEISGMQPIADNSCTSSVRSCKDFSCQVWPSQLSKSVQVGPSLTHAVDVALPDKHMTGNGTENFIECKSKINDSILTGIEVHDSSDHQGKVKYTSKDISHADIKPQSISQNQQLAVVLNLIESNTKSFLGIDQNHSYVITTLEGFGKVNRTDILICLWKLRRNESEECLGAFFGKSKSIISKTLSHCFPVLATLFKNYITWPESHIIQSNIPLPFREQFSNVESIIDCLEVKIDKPHDPTHHSLTWSDSKNCNTMKFLISCTPGGFINFLSGAYGGGASDMHIVLASGYLDKIKKNTIVVAHEKFKQLETEMSNRECALICPPINVPGVKMTDDNVRLMKQIAGLRSKVEQVIRRISEFEYLGPRTCFNRNQLAFMDQAAIIACGLLNLQNPLAAIFTGYVVNVS